MPAEARIATLRVAAHGRVGVPTAQTLVEDALRTSYSAVGPLAARGLLVVRHLDAGRAAEVGDRQAVGRRVAMGLREAAARAVPANSPGALSAPAVFFEDRAQPYTMLGEAVAQDTPLARAWFFRAALGPVAGTAPERIAGLLLRAAAEPFATVLVPEILSHAAPVAEAALGALTPAQGESLLQAWAPPAGARPRPGRPADPARVQARITQAPAVIRRVAAALAHRFGPDDPRTRLAIVAVLAQTPRPVLWADIAVAGRLLAVAADPAPPSGTDGPEATTDEPLTIPRDPGQRPAPERPTPPDRPPRTAQPHQDRAAATSPPPPAGQPRDDTVDPLRPQPAPDAAASEAPQSPVRTHARATDASPAKPSPNADLPAPSRPARQTTAPPTGPDGPSPGDPTGQPENFPAPVDAEAGHTTDPPPQAAFGTPTAWAGGALLVGLLTRLLPGLVTGEDAEADELGRCLLDGVLARAGCPPGDAARRALGPTEPAAMLPAIGAVHLLPGAERWLARGPLSLHPVAGRPGWRALHCGRRRLVLALWHGRAAGPVRAAMRRLGIRRGPMLGDPMTRLIPSAELILRRAVKDLTGHRLSALAGRSGWIARTRTHLDVTFDAGLVDMAIRRAGLDLDPGWCPWFRRVVTIHYDFGGGDA